MRAVIIVSLLTLNALAGCTGDGSGADPDLTGDGGTGMAVVDDRVTMQANTSATETIEITGSGAPSPHESLCATGCNLDQYSLTDAMEPGTAYFVEGELTTSPSPGGARPVFINLVGDVGVRDYNGMEFSPGRATFTATLLAAGESDVYLEIGANGLVGEDGSTQYDLEVTMTPVPDAIPQYAPAAVRVPEGGALGIESQSGAGRVMVFDGDDALVGIKSVDGGLTVVVDNVSQAQEFVIVTMDDIWAKAYVLQDVDASEPELRHLPITMEWNEHGTVNSGGQQEFTFEAQMPLLQTGFAFGFQTCIPGTCYRAVDWSAILFDQDGVEVVSNSGNCELCGGSQGFFTDFIDGGSWPAGEYTLQFDSEDSMNVEIRTVEVSYGR